MFLTFPGLLQDLSWKFPGQTQGVRPRPESLRLCPECFRIRPMPPDLGWRISGLSRNCSGLVLPRQTRVGMFLDLSGMFQGMSCGFPGKSWKFLTQV